MYIYIYMYITIPRKKVFILKQRPVSVQRIAKLSGRQYPKQADTQERSCYNIIIYIPNINSGYPIILLWVVRGDSHHFKSDVVCSRIIDCECDHERSRCLTSNTFHVPRLELPRPMIWSNVTSSVQNIIRASDTQSQCVFSLLFMGTFIIQETNFI